MRLHSIAVICTASVALQSPAWSDTYCDQIRRYERASFETAAAPDGLPDRWVEMHWVGFWMDFDRGFGKKCRSSEDVASRDLCVWLLEHSSTEFPTYTPFKILECYGHRFPSPRPQWSRWKVNIEINSDRWVALDVDLTGWETESGAVRLGVYRDDDSPWGDAPPLAPLPRDDQNKAP